MKEDPAALDPQAGELVPGVKKAGLPEIPVNISIASPEEATRLKDEAAMAKAERTERCRY